jgi:hypothetical protein
MASNKSSPASEERIPPGKRRARRGKKANDV